MKAARISDWTGAARTIEMAGYESGAGVVSGDVVSVFVVIGLYVNRGRHRGGE